MAHQELVLVFLLFVVGNSSSFFFFFVSLIVVVNCGLYLAHNSNSLDLVAGVLGSDDHFFTDCGHDCNDDSDVFLAELVADLLAELAIGNLQIVARVTLVVHERREAIVADVDELEVATRHVRHVNVVRRRAQIFILLAREDVETDEMHLRMTVLARLGRRHFDHLARTRLDHDVAVLAQRRTLHRIRGGRAGIAALKFGVITFHLCIVALLFVLLLSLIKHTIEGGRAALDDDVLLGRRRCAVDVVDDRRWRWRKERKT